MLPYDWETDPWSWLEQRSGDSCLGVNYYAVSDRTRPSEDRQRPGLRLIKIEPGAAQDPLRCSLTLTDSELLEGPNKTSRHPYDAVSYVWGSSDDLVPLRCKTDELYLDFSYSRLPITKNCAEVFRHLRNRNQTSHVWVDAVSIDQTDPTDRAHYVRRMHHIYRDARKVIVVLPNYKKASGEYWAESEVGEWIFTHRYFTRIWILQEVFWGQNPVVYAGHHELQWSDLCNLYYKGQRGGTLVSREARTSVELVLAMGQSKNNSISRGGKRSSAYQQNSLLELYRLSKSFEATDQRDKLIALISMADVTPQMEKILVDYTVAHDVLLSRFAATLCFRSLNVMPGVERGIDNSRMAPGVNCHHPLQRCTKKIEDFMRLSTTDAPDLSKTLSLRTAERYIWDVAGNEPSFRHSISNILRTKVSSQGPLDAVVTVVLCAIVTAALTWYGIDRLEGRHLFKGSQSRKMTVSELLGIIEESKALIRAAHSDDELRRKDRALARIATMDGRLEDKTTVRVAIQGYQHFDLCLIPGNVNGLQRGCKRAWVKFSNNSGEFQSDPVPLLLRSRSGRLRVLGSFYDFGPTPTWFSPSCCYAPQIKHDGSKLPRAVSTLNGNELIDIVGDWTWI